jgi:acyl-CoA synthetase (AMP-forming)/AMP-acid ligase II
MGVIWQRRLEELPVKDASGLTKFADATVATRIAQNVAIRPECPAIVMSRGKVLTYRALGEQIAAFGAGLRANGMGRSSTVAIMLPDGPELAVAIVATACHAVAVPLNPKLTATELDSLFAMLHVDAMVISNRVDSTARDVAARHGTRLLDAASGGPGILTFSAGAAVPSARADSELALERGAQPNDLALILRTSATTGRPKLVPVTHRNLVIGADRRRVWFNLTPDDRTLCAMPLHYAQGLRGELFPPLLVGGSIACPNRDAGGDIIDWLADLRPTCYAGTGQAFHLSVLERAQARQRALRHCLRFIRSGGAPLSAAVRQGLEQVFGVPVLEAYSLSETGTVAANSIAPEGRKAGTMGRPWPNEVAIRAADGRLLPPGAAGEIVVRGPGLMPRYLDNGEANSAAMVDGWFLTGDLGLIDAEGFLTLLGRLKEFINRGGEKISPDEVEQALLLHPSVREAAAFSVPHPRLGENVAAAIVLKPGTSTTPAEIRTFLSNHLAPYKIPQHLDVKPDLPKGDSGKTLRRQLSEAAAGRIREIVPPIRPLHFQIMEIWQRLLGRSDIGIDDDFFEAGGDSLLATQMVCEVETITRQHISLSALKGVYTVRELAAAVVRASPVELVTRVKDGNRRPFLFCHGDFTTRGFYALKLAGMLTCDRPVYLLHPHPDPDPKLTIEEMARAYVPHVLAAQPSGAFLLGGTCNGGLLAWEIACRLERLGREVEVVVLIDTISLNARPVLRAVAGLIRFIVAVAPKKISEKVKLNGMRSVWRRGKWHLSRYGSYSRAISNYVPSRIRSRVFCVVCEESRPKTAYSPMPWTNLASAAGCEYVAGTHISCVTTHVGEVARLLDGLLSEPGRLDHQR